MPQPTRNNVGMKGTTRSRSDEWEVLKRLESCVCSSPPKRRSQLESITLFQVARNWVTGGRRENGRQEAAAVGRKHSQPKMVRLLPAPASCVYCLLSLATRKKAFAACDSDAPLR